MSLLKSLLHIEFKAALRAVAIVSTAVLSSACAQNTLTLPGLAVAEATAATDPVETGSLPPVKEAAPDLKPSTAAAIAEARQARTGGDKAKAMSILDKAAAADAKDRALTKERGLLALDMGQLKRAEDLLRKAHDPKAPDWRLHSALGSALAAQGKQPEAQMQFAKALEMAPDHPSVLNNLALSYALDGKHDEAEKLLKRVGTGKAADPKAQQNLALILGLKGKIDEAKKVSEATLPADKAKANISYLSSLKQSGENARISRAEPQVADEGIRAASSQ